MSPLRPNDFEIQNRHPAYIFKNMRYCSNSQQVKPAPSAISRQCPQCRLHILSACQRTQIRNMITERLNLACRMTFKAVSKTGSLGSCVVSMDIGSNERMTMRNLQISETAESRIVPKWLFPPRFSDKDRFTSSRPDFVLVTPIATETEKQHQTYVGGGFFEVAGGNSGRLGASQQHRQPPVEPPTPDSTDL